MNKPASHDAITPHDSASSLLSTTQVSVSPAVSTPRFPAGTRRPLRIKDDHLRRVLEGKDFLVFDGAMGTQLQAHGMPAGAIPELLCLSNPDLVTAIHRSYVEAGSEVVTCNSFGASAPKLGDACTVDELFLAAVRCAQASGARYVAADIGPTGSLLEPMGPLSFDDAYELFAEQVRAADAAGADLFIIETMADLAEAKAALLAAREYSDLPVFVTMTFDADGRTFLGTTPEAATVTLCALGADAVGINCSLGPSDVLPLIQRVCAWADCPVIAQANAGLPHTHDQDTVYDVSPADYVAAIEAMVDAGVTIVGGCCGTTPDYIAAEVSMLTKKNVHKRVVQDNFVVASSQEIVSLRDGDIGVIGERINPTGKRRMKEALQSGNYDYILSLAIEQTQAGAQILDVNAGLPEINEAEILQHIISDLQAVTSLPLQIDSAVPAVIEQAIRRYPGKPIINSTNGRDDVLRAVVPLAAHYGCALVGLTIDEEGIPTTAEGRLSIAKKIVQECDKWDIARHDIIIDCLAMAASTDQHAPRAILDGIRLVKQELPGVRCVLGVSNISFGLPFRPLVNATFLAAACAAGLDLCIINPAQQRMMDVVHSWRVLSGEDSNAQYYVENYASRTDAVKRQLPTGDSSHASTSTGELPGALPAEMSSTGDAATKAHAIVGTAAAEAQAKADDAATEAHAMVLAGRKEPMDALIRHIIEQHDTMFAINHVLIPALDEVGRRFEKGVFFLPQLMASAEAAKAGFDTIRLLQKDSTSQLSSKGSIALCTVKGDIHDIGKNIVRMLLENYGYTVFDLGRDCEPERLCDTVVQHHIELVGLSALMTATVPAMAETIELLRARAPWCKIVVGGAVLNPEYAQMVGADFYAKDANEAAHIAAEVLG